MKMAHASGKALEETQMLKITREDAVRKELAGYVSLSKWYPVLIVTRLRGE